MAADLDAGMVHVRTVHFHSSSRWWEVAVGIRCNETDLVVAVGRLVNTGADQCHCYNSPPPLLDFAPSAP